MLLYHRDFGNAQAEAPNDHDRLRLTRLYISDARLKDTDEIPYSTGTGVPKTGLPIYKPTHH